MTRFLFLYLLFINVAAFAAMFADKRRAVQRRWRVPERTLFFLAFIGGAAGALLGMFIFRHKTRHLSFRVLLPLFLLLNLICVFFLWKGGLL